MVGFYKHDIPAWMDGTENLSDAAYRAYHVVVQLIMLNEGPITPNDRGIAGRCNQTVKTFTKALAELMAAGKLTLREGRICNARAAVELSFVEKNRENAGKGGKTRAFREKSRETERTSVPKPLENNNTVQAALETASSLKDETRLDETREDTSLRSVDAKPKKQRAKPKTPICEDTQPTERQLQDAYDEGLALPQIRMEWRGFRDHHLKHGTLFSDWPAAWRSWLRNPIRSRSTTRASPTSRGSTADLWAADAIEGNAEIQGGHHDQRSYDDGGHWDHAGRQADGRPYRDAPQSAGNDPRQLPTLRLVGSL